MLTDHELEVAAACAENYPPGYGTSYFVDEKITSVSSAIVRLRDDPTTAKFG